MAAELSQSEVAEGLEELATAGSSFQRLRAEVMAEQESPREEQELWELSYFGSRVARLGTGP